MKKDVICCDPDPFMTGITWVAVFLMGQADKPTLGARLSPEHSSLRGAAHYSVARIRETTQAGLGRCLPSGYD